MLEHLSHGWGGAVSTYLRGGVVLGVPLKRPTTEPGDGPRTGVGPPT